MTDVFVLDPVGNGPVVITDGDGNTQALTRRYGDSNYGSATYGGTIATRTYGRLRLAWLRDPLGPTSVGGVSMSALAYLRDPLGPTSVRSLVVDLDLPPYVQNDTQPAVTCSLYDGNGNPINLTGYTVNIELVDERSGRTITGTCTIVNAASGQVSWKPLAADTATPGKFVGRFRVTQSAGNYLSVPNDGVVRLDISPRTVKVP